MINKKSIFVTSLTIIILVVIYCLIFNNNDLDTNIEYKSYIQKWSRWTKNGKTSGNVNSKDSIKNIKFQFDNKDYFSYDIFTKNEWKNDLYVDSKHINSEIKGIRLYLYKKYNKKYQICYRTHNDKDKWLGWSCDGIINGNAKYPINAIEVKIIPKNVSLYEYLKDYDASKTNMLNF